MPNYKSNISGAKKTQSGFGAFGFLVLSVIALYLPDPSQDQVASFLRASVLRPFILTQEALLRRSIHAEDTEVLQARLDALQVVIMNRSGLSEENAQLRRLLDLSERSSARYVAAELISAGESMFQLTVGVRRGVTRDSPVVTARGLLGVVRTAAFVPGAAIHDGQRIQSDSIVWFLFQRFEQIPKGGIDIASRNSLTGDIAIVHSDIRS